MIVVASKPGRLGNLLIVYANLLAWAFEYDKTIVNPAFSAYRKYFRKTGKLTAFIQNAGYKVAYYSARIIDRLGISNPLVGARHLDWEEKTLLDNDKALPSSPLYFVQGWQYRSERLLTKHADRIREFFTPLPFYRAQLDLLWKDSVRAGDVVLGVHIRRGDYKSFEKGSYFFDAAVYEKLITRFLELLGSERVSILICSDDPAMVSYFQKSNLKIVPSPGHELLDMYALARCGYILGPPSTYSMWASFYGEVPLYMLRDPQREFGISDFKIQTSF